MTHRHTVSAKSTQITKSTQSTQSTQSTKRVQLPSFRVITSALVMMSVFASCDAQRAHLNVEITGPGRVVSHDRSIDCPSQCSSEWSELEEVALIFTPEPEATLARVSGCQAFELPTSGAVVSWGCPITLSPDTRVVVAFESTALKPTLEPTELRPAEPVGVADGEPVSTHDDGSANTDIPESSDLISDLAERDELERWVERFDELDDPELEIHFIDVGQGDSILIRGPEGLAGLIDGGRSSDQALAYLEAQGIEALDFVIASHPDADHIGGLSAVIERFPPRLYIDNGTSKTTRVYLRLLDTLAELGVEPSPPQRREIRLGDAVITVIPPPHEGSYSDNNRSIGVLLEYGEFKASFTGDAERQEFEWWLTHEPDLLRDVDVHKSSHHGSSNGDTAKSVEALLPELVVIGVGADNHYGHPTVGALDLYDSVSSTVCRTDLHGNLTVIADQRGRYQVSSERGHCAPAFTAP